MGEQKKDNEQLSDEAYGLTVIVFILIAFIITGIIALVWSFVCLGKSGTPFEKFIGVVIAFMTGPFYFIYYGFNTNYCRDTVAASTGGKKKK